MTDIVDIGARRLEGGYFLVRGPAPRPFPGHAAPADGPYRHCFTYERSSRTDRQTIKNALLELLHGARRKVFITSFRIGDKDLIAALEAAARRLRGGVYVITELDLDSLRRGLAEMEDDAEADLQAQQKDFHAMTQQGIYVRGHRDCHAKFAVVDDEKALVSSANLETNAFEKTGESGVVVGDRAEVGRLARFFTRLWHGCEWEMAPGMSYLTTEREPQPCPCRVPPPVVPPPERAGCGVIWTDGEEQYILQTIHDVIGRARRELVLATFSLAGLTGDRELLLGPLERVLRGAGPRVRLLARSRNHLEGARKDAEALAELGVEIYADGRNHAKGAIADRRYGALFSANFDAQHGLRSGVEVGVRLDEQPVLADALEYFEHALAQANIRFVVRPTQREAAESLGVGWREAWPLDSTVRLACPSGAWQGLCTAAERGPILFTRKGGGSVHLYAGRQCWRLDESGGAPLSLVEVRPSGDKPAAGAEGLAAWLRDTKPRPGRLRGRRGKAAAVSRTVRPSLKAGPGMDDLTPRFDGFRPDASGAAEAWRTPPEPLPGPAPGLRWRRAGRHGFEAVRGLLGWLGRWWLPTLLYVGLGGVLAWLFPPGGAVVLPAGVLGWVGCVWWEWNTRAAKHLGSFPALWWQAVGGGLFCLLLLLFDLTLPWTGWAGCLFRTGALLTGLVLWSQCPEPERRNWLATMRRGAAGFLAWMRRRWYELLGVGVAVALELMWAASWDWNLTAAGVGAVALLVGFVVWIRRQNDVRPFLRRAWILPAVVGLVALCGFGWWWASGRELRSSHDKEDVYAVAFSPDGRYAYVAGVTEIDWWDPSAEKSAGVVVKLGAPARCMSVSPDGRHVLARKGDWAVADGSIVLGDHSGQWRSVRLALSDKEGTQYVKGIKCAVLSPDDRRLLTGGADGVWVWDAQTGVELLRFPGNYGSKFVDVSPRGDWVVSDGPNGAAVVWQLETGRGVSIITDPHDSITAAAFCPDGRRIVSGGREGAVKVWDAATAAERGRVGERNGSIRHVAVSADGRRALTADSEGNVVLWQLPLW